MLRLTRTGNSSQSLLLFRAYFPSSSWCETIGEKLVNFSTKSLRFSSKDSASSSRDGLMDSVRKNSTATISDGPNGSGVLSCWGGSHMNASTESGSGPTKFGTQPCTRNPGTPHGNWKPFRLASWSRSQCLKLRLERIVVPVIVGAHTRPVLGLQTPSTESETSLEIFLEDTCICYRGTVFPCDWED